MSRQTSLQTRVSVWMHRLLLACCCCLLAACMTSPFGSGGTAARKNVPAPAAPAPSAAPTASSASGDAAQQGLSACIVLALPDNGPFIPFAEKIRAGAIAAQQEMAKGGFRVEVRAVNAAQPDWIAQVDALPPACAVVGGPLQAQAYSAAKGAGLTSRRALFAFLPQLTAGDEGNTAWRFFPGHEDQVQALLRFTKELGISAYGSFYPADAYGTRMNALFAKAVQASGGSLQSASYPLADMSQWTKSAQELLKPRTVNKVPLPTATFEALFLPDSWKHMDMVTNSLLYNGEDRQVLLGTSLWELGLQAQSTVNTYNFQLAVFPGAWDPNRVPQGLQALPVRDFWVGLGYDFVRFGAALQLKAQTPPATVNARIQQAQNIFWGMAPIHWTPQGKASQQLFLFTPAPTGFAPLDMAAFKERRAQILSRFETRSRTASAQQ